MAWNEPTILVLKRMTASNDAESDGEKRKKKWVVHLKNEETKTSVDDDISPKLFERALHTIFLTSIPIQFNHHVYSVTIIFFIIQR